MDLVVVVASVRIPLRDCKRSILIQINVFSWSKMYDNFVNFPSLGEVDYSLLR